MSEASEASLEPTPGIQLRPKIHPRHEMILSVDLGKRQDHTAYIISEATPVMEKTASGDEKPFMHIYVHNIVRLALDPNSTTFYRDLAVHLYDLYHDPRLWLMNPVNHTRFRPEFLLDVGGPGEPVGDDLERSMGMRTIRYQLVRGTSRVNRHKRLRWTVPRLMMFQMLHTAFDHGRITINQRLKHAEGLKQELQNLKREVNEETNYVRVTHREGEHDDMSICLASTVWW